MLVYLESFNPNIIYKINPFNQNNKNDPVVVHYPLGIRVFNINI